MKYELHPCPYMRKRDERKKTSDNQMLIDRHVENLTTACNVRSIWKLHKFQEQNEEV